MTREALVAAIRAASAPKPHGVTVPVLGQVFVRVMTPYDSEMARRSLEQHRKDDGCEIGRLLASVLCDENGAPLFDAGSDDDVLMLSKLPGKVNDAVFKAHRVANGMVSTDEEAAALGKA